MDLITAGDAQVAKTGANGFEALLVLLVRHELVSTQLEKLPFLVDLLDLTIDVLLNLLGLLVQLDEFTRANGVVVGVDTSAALDEVVDGMDALGRGADKTILSLGMAAGDGLAGDLLNTRGLDSEWRLVHMVQGHDARLVVNHGDSGRLLRSRRRIKGMSSRGC